MLHMVQINLIYDYLSRFVPICVWMQMDYYVLSYDITMDFRLVDLQD